MADDFKIKEVVKNLPVGDGREITDLGEAVFGNVSIETASIIHGLILASGGMIIVPADIFADCERTNLFIKHNPINGATMYKVEKE